MNYGIFNVVSQKSDDALQSKMALLGSFSRVKGDKSQVNYPLFYIDGIYVIYTMWN